MQVFSAWHQNQPEASMNNGTKRDLFPGPTGDVFRQSGHCVDNVFTSVWKV